MRSLFGIEISAPVQYLIAFVIIFVLLALFAVVLRRVSAPRGNTANQAGGRSRQPRLGVIDSFDIDRKRQLVLVRRDHVEHLLMIGGPNDVVIESSIIRNAQRSAPPPSPPASVGDALAQISGSPALAIADPVPPLRPSAIEARQDTRPETTQEGRAPESRMPERTGAASFPLSGDRAPAPPEASPPGRDTARPSARDLARDFGRERPSTTNGTQPPAPRPRPPLPSAARAPTPQAEAKPAPAPPAGANAPEDELAAMTRQLGEVLQRPFAAERLAERAPSHSTERPAAPATLLATARPRQSASLPLQERPTGTEKPAMPAQDAPAAAAEAPRPPSGPHPSQNGEIPPSSSSTSPSEPPAKATVDPFSVDDIEAEFARLLGRIPPR
ncbi:hypothetical protein ACFQU1_05435 [Chelatococcus sp. GCM10030263]|uniref:hypothetical protein n=1 Tax=Chelatococcus sp. GCM10030263 TaxID=3273387 RepID=UPI00360C3574